MNYLMLGLANLDFVVDVAILLDLVATQAIPDYYHGDQMLDKLVYYSNPDFVAKYDISFLWLLEWELTIWAPLNSLLLNSWAIPGVKSGFLYGSSLPSLWSTGPFQGVPGTNGGGPVSPIFGLSGLFILRPAIESSNVSSSNFGLSFPQLGFRSFGGGKLELK